MPRWQDPTTLDVRLQLADVQRRLAVIEQKLGIETLDPPALQASERVLDLVARGQKIDAIKAHCEETGVDPKTAKEMIDQLPGAGG